LSSQAKFKIEDKFNNQLLYNLFTKIVNQQILLIFILTEASSMIINLSIATIIFWLCTGFYLPKNIQLQIFFFNKQKRFNLFF